MGRKRKKFGEQTQPISISLPRNLIMDLDKTLDDEHTRSRVFERLLRDHLKKSTNLLNFERRHCYYCKNCNRSWHQNQYKDPKFWWCSGKTGCGSSDIVYDGILGEEE